MLLTRCPGSLALAALIAEPRCSAVLGVFPFKLSQVVLLQEHLQWPPCQWLLNWTKKEDCRAVSRKVLTKPNVGPACLTQESCGMGLPPSLCHQNHPQKENCHFARETPGFYIHFGINWAHTSAEGTSVREPTRGSGHLHWGAAPREMARTKVGVGRRFMPAIFTNGRTELPLQLMLACQSPSWDSKRAEEWHFHSLLPVKMYLIQTQKNIPFVFFSNLIIKIQSCYFL